MAAPPVSEVSNAPSLSQSLRLLRTIASVDRSTGDLKEAASDLGDLSDLNNLESDRTFLSDDIHLAGLFEPHENLEKEHPDAKALGESISGPLWNAPGSLRAIFLLREWLPFVKMLRRHLLDLRGAKAAFGLLESTEEVPPHRLPSQKDLRLLVKTNLELTERWYGPGCGNISAVYEFFMEMHVIAGLVKSPWATLAKHRSRDGFLVAVDNSARSASRYGGGGSASSVREEERLGALPKTRGESAIDTTVQSGVLLPQEARRLARGGHCAAFVVCSVARLQRRYLRITAQLSDDDLAHRLQSGVCTPEEVASAVDRACQDEDRAREAGLRLDSLALAALRRTGRVVSSFADLPAEMQKNLNKEMEARAGDDPTANADADDSVCEEANHYSSQLQRFVKFLREKPGRVFEGDLRLHKKLLVVAMWKNDIKVLPRSTVERYQIERYLSLKWVRRVPLLGIDEQGHETELRAAGQQVRPCRSPSTPAVLPR
jgi:hypothetical protein